MAEDYVTVDAERSRFFGPDGSYEQYGNGVTVTNLDSDFFWQQIIDSGVIDHLLSLPPPLGLEPQAKQTVAGYVAGYNRYLRGRRRHGRRLGSDLPRQAVGPPDHPGRRLPPLLPAGRAGQRRRGHPGHRRGPASDAGRRLCPPMRRRSMLSPGHGPRAGRLASRRARREAMPSRSGGTARVIIATVCCSATRTSPGRHRALLPVPGDDPRAR